MGFSFVCVRVRVDGRHVGQGELCDADERAVRPALETGETYGGSRGSVQFVDRLAALE